MTRVLVITVIFFSLFSLAQDVHYSQFDKTKSLLNPSLIPHQDEDYEIHVQRRSQWSRVTVPFNTFALSFNTKKLYKDLSLGLTVLNDLAGDSYFSTDGVVFSIANHIATKENTLYLGIQTALYQRSVNFDNLIFIESEELQNAKFSFFDFALGISNHKTLNQHSSLLIGLSSYHLNNPRQSLMSNQKVVLNTKYVFHCLYYTSVSSKIDISPTLYFSSQAQDRELIIGNGLEYYLNEKVKLKTGIYSRVKDSFFVTLGVKKGDLEAIISYDINTSALSTASNYMGGFEFSISYAWSAVKEKQVEQKKICPKYL